MQTSITNCQVTDHVLCSRLGDEEFEITKVDSLHFWLKSTTAPHKVAQMYKQHCSATVKILRGNIERRNANRIARAEKIGRPRK